MRRYRRGYRHREEGEPIKDYEKITWVIGDIHGMFDALRTLVEHLDNDYVEKFVFVGDYIDHGPSSKEVIDYIMGMGDKAIALMGNHEHLMLETLFSEKFQAEYGDRIWEENGVRSTLNSFDFDTIDDLRKNIDPKYIDFLKNLQCFHQVNLKGTDYIIYDDDDDRETYEARILITHAGIMTDVPLEEQIAAKNYADHNKLLEDNNIWIENSFVWTREKFFRADPALWDNYTVIHGHTPTHLLNHSIRDFERRQRLDEDTQIYIRKEREGYEHTFSVDIDTGAAFGKRLTAVGLSSANLQSYGWLNLEVVQLNLENGYYRTSPFIHKDINLRPRIIDHR